MLQTRALVKAIEVLKVWCTHLKYTLNLGLVICDCSSVSGGLTEHFYMQSATEMAVPRVELRTSGKAS